MSSSARGKSLTSIIPPMRDSFSSLRRSPRAFFSNARGALGAGGNPCANTSLAWGGLFGRSWYRTSKLGGMEEHLASWTKGCEEIKCSGE
jgi:hypothetical protein